MSTRGDLETQLERHRRKVDVDHLDITIRELIRMTAEQEIIRAPQYQRKFRWNPTLESRLIESLFLGLPVPSLFVASNADGTWELIDGLQRLSTLMHYIADPPELLATLGHTEPLRLIGLDTLTHFNGLSFDDLHAPQQLAFYKRTVRVTALSDKSDFDVRFDMFERLNSGALQLTPQEVRTCIYRGEFAELMLELSAQPTFRKIVKVQKGHQDDGTFEELVLKFFAYSDRRDEFDGKVTKFLNDYMKDMSPKFDYKKGRSLFDQTTDLLASWLDNKPFLRRGVHLTPLNQLEAVMVAVADHLRAKRKIRSPKPGWLEDRELVRSSTGGTNTKSMLLARISRAAALIDGATPEPITGRPGRVGS